MYLRRLPSKQGIRLVLHMHNSLLHPRSKKHIPALKDVPIVFCSEFLRQEAVSAYPGHLASTHMLSITELMAISSARKAGNRRPCRRSSSLGAWSLIRAYMCCWARWTFCRSRGIKAKCTIVGGSAFGGSRPTRYVHKLRRIRPSNTELIGYRAGVELADLLRDADIFCCPSIWNDPFPMAILEAMATGLPIVASATGGIPEQLAHGGGVTVPPNDEEALATELQRLLDDGSSRQRLGGEALTASRDYFLWDSVRRQYQAFVRGLAS